VGTVLLVDDDPDQLTLRGEILTIAGHQVTKAAGAAQALEALSRDAPKLVIMDLRLPHAEDGLALIRQIRPLYPQTRLVVLSGWAGDLAGTPERDMVDEVLRKPVRSKYLVDMVSKFAILLFCLCLGLTGGAPRAFANNAQPFQLDTPAEVVAEIELSVPGADWGRQGREAILATVTVDDSAKLHIMTFAGADRYKYRVFLGELPAGAHQVRIEKHPDYSARGLLLQVHGITFRQYKPSDAEYAMIAHAPVLYARANTIGKFDDIPLLTYCEKLGDGSLRYSVIFSNEDGGTSTRALMARWGRATDIEHVYQVWLDASGKPQRALIQSPGHKDIDFPGKREGMHPLLAVTTDNNMVEAGVVTAVRYQLAPIEAELGFASREKVMDENPITYEVTTRELEREGKLRKFDTVEGTKISAPENYLRLEMRIATKNARLAVLVRLEGENFFRSSHLGITDMAIERSGWVRTAVELPPATQPTQVAELAWQCLPEPKTSESPGSCRVDAVSKVFFLNASHQPDASFWRPRLGDRFPHTLAPGQTRLVPLR
jgi:CheY-like chemotaxis protein